MMKYIIIILFIIGIVSPVLAQNEKKITIQPFRPPKERIKRSQSSNKKTSKKPAVPQKETLDKKRMEKIDTVDDYLRRKSQPLTAPSSSSAYVTTVPGFISGERSRYQRGETASTKDSILFTFGPYDKYNQDARNRPAYPESYKDGGNGAGIGLDMNKVLSMAFSKKARLRAHNEKKRLWEKYPKVIPDDSLVNSLNVKPQKMLSVKQQRDSLTVIKDSVIMSKDTVTMKRRKLIHNTKK